MKETNRKSVLSICVIGFLLLNSRGSGAAWSTWFNFSKNVVKKSCNLVVFFKYLLYLKFKEPPDCYFSVRLFPKLIRFNHAISEYTIQGLCEEPVKKDRNGFSIGFSFFDDMVFSFQNWLWIQIFSNKRKVASKTADIEKMKKILIFCPILFFSSKKTVRLPIFSVGL